MKKVLFSLLFVVISLSAMAQNDSTSIVIRNGNKYIVNDTICMNKRAFMGFLQSQNQISYNSFRSAYRLSNVGWGLFAGGLAVSLSAFPVIYATATSPVRSGETDAETTQKAASTAVLAGYGMMVVGDLTTVAGITCVTLGYVRMHQAADNFNLLQAHRRNKQDVKVAMQSSRDGIGIALQF